MTKMQRDRIARKAARLIVEQITVRRVAKIVREKLGSYAVFYPGDVLTLNYEIKLKITEKGEEIIK